MNIIGISGFSGSGKDTLADIFVGKYDFVKIAFADPIKRICQEYWDFSDEQLWGKSEYRNKPDKRYLKLNGEYLTPREALQKFGMQGRYIEQNVWTRYTLKLSESLLKDNKLSYTGKKGLYKFPHITKAVVISDCRFLNEMEMIREKGGFLIRVKRNSKRSLFDKMKSFLGGLTFKKSFRDNESEISMNNIPDDYFDFVINNDQDIEHLKREADCFISSFVNK